MQIHSNSTKLLLVFFAAVLILVGCGGGGGGTGSGTSIDNQTFSVSVSVSGLANGQQFVLQNNGGDPLTISSNAEFTFAHKIVQNGSYVITIASQPVGQVCTVSNGSGAGVVASVTNVAVACSTDTYTISGTINGLANGQTLILLNNSSNALSVTANGLATFSIPVAYNGSYSVSVGTQPTGQICTVSNGQGNGVVADVSNVIVNCSTDTYPVSVIVGGLALGQQVTLNNNGSNPTIVTSNGTFNFSVPVAYNGSYSVTVGTQPTNEVCTVSNGAGAGVVGIVSPVLVNCSTDTYTISGTVTGLAVNQQVTLNNNGANPTTVTSNTAFSFSIPVTFNSSYTVGVPAQPTGQTCTVSNATGLSISQNVNNVLVSCSSNETDLYSFGGVISDGATPSGSLTQGSDGNFYGTTDTGGTSGNGTFFKVTPSGVETTLYSFAGSPSDGANPVGKLLLGSDGNFYGMTYGGGTGSGTIFKVTPEGIETPIHLFGQAGNDGSYPVGSLTLGNDGNFYGMNPNGGIGYGDVFKVTPAGLVTVLYSFGNVANDGKNPQGDLALGNDGNFYGMTRNGGASGNGMIFKITPAGIETPLYSFAGVPTDGANPYGTLTLGTDGNFYGVTYDGGQGNGNIFKVSPTGMEAQIYRFGSTIGDGAHPFGSLVLGPDGNFYGMTHEGGANNLGAIFQVTPSGVEKTVYSFSGAGKNGSNPYSNNLVLGFDGNLYGLTFGGGAYAKGTMFKYTP